MNSIRKSLAAAGLILAASTGAWAAPELNVSSGGVLVDGKVAPGIAVHGYDVVAYFKDSAPTPGLARYATVYKGATFRFASQANLEEFKANPAKFEPAYGGYCAYGVAVGGKFDGDPRFWKIVDGKLYLNVSGEVQQEWDKDIPGYLRKADTNWKEIARK